MTGIPEKQPLIENYVSSDVKKYIDDNVVKSETGTGSVDTYNNFISQFFADVFNLSVKVYAKDGDNPPKVYHLNKDDFKTWCENNQVGKNFEKKENKDVAAAKYIKTAYANSHVDRIEVSSSPFFPLKKEKKGQSSIGEKLEEQVRKHEKQKTALAKLPGAIEKEQDEDKQLNKYGYAYIPLENGESRLTIKLDPKHEKLFGTDRVEVTLNFDKQITMNAIPEEFNDIVDDDSFEKDLGNRAAETAVKNLKNKIIAYAKNLDPKEPKESVTSQTKATESTLKASKREKITAQREALLELSGAADSVEDKGKLERKLERYGYVCYPSGENNLVLVVNSKGRGKSNAANHIQLSLNLGKEIKINASPSEFNATISSVAFQSTLENKGAKAAVKNLQTLIIAYASRESENEKLTSEPKSELESKPKQDVPPNNVPPKYEEKGGTGQKPITDNWHW